MTVPKITPEALKQRLAGEADLVLIDTLPGEVYMRRHLPGALNACVYEVTFPGQVDEIVPDRDRPIVVYGSGPASRDAETAAEKLLTLGYGRVHALEGGLVAWREAGFPIEGREIDAPDDPGTRLRIPDGVYTVDTEQSVLEWVGRSHVKKHHGTVNLESGRIHVQNGTATGSFALDMRTIRNVDLTGDPLQPVLLGHLRSEDFFFVKMFPRATFTITSAEPVPEPILSSPNVRVEGILAVRGVKRALSFQATAGALTNGGMAVEAHFDWDRTQWNVLYGSARFFEYLGMHLVLDLISVQLWIVAR